jgi:glycosyltransferase involved in cell wall biosynthesis
MTPQVSVIIKSYNHAAFVGETIRSILDQSFQDFEIVVTDDGSTDGTPDVIRRFADPRIHLRVFEKNRGISIAMNDTIARARGEFIAILNSDDFALPGRLERQAGFLSANLNIAAVFTLPKTVDDAGQPTASYFDFTLPFSLADLSQASVLRQFFFHCNFLCAPTTMIRRAAYARIGLYDPRYTNLQDFDMWVRLCVEHEIHVMREELTAFRIRDGNGNVSAPRRDTLLRSQFEMAHILRRYRAMNPGLLRKIFAADLAAKGLSPEGPPDLWLAELALGASTPAHWMFALETLFEAASSDREFLRLRDAAGSVDVFGFQGRSERAEKDEELYQAKLMRDNEITKLSRVLVERDGQIAMLGQEIAVLSRETARRDDQIAALGQELARRHNEMQTLLRSRSWRYTAALRRLMERWR